jgi:type IV pilus assembly protein PilV
MITRNKEQGFTLLEVLVTLVIFAFGMLGVAGLQMVSLTNMDSAQNRSVASLKAAEMGERIRANPGAAYSGTVPADNACRTAHFTDRHSVPAVCAPLLMAADDLNDWGTELAARLPGGSGIVCIDSTPDDGLPGATACDGAGTALAIKVWWKEKPKNAAAVIPKRIAIQVAQ